MSSLDDKRSNDERSSNNRLQIISHHKHIDHPDQISLGDIIVLDSKHDLYGAGHTNSMNYSEFLVVSRLQDTRYQGAFGSHWARRFTVYSGSRFYNLDIYLNSMFELIRFDLWNL